MRDFRLDSIPGSRGVLMTARILVGALAMGVMIFGGIAMALAFANHQAPREGLPIVSYLMAGMGAMTLVMSFVIQNIIIAPLRRELGSIPGDQQAERVLPVYQTRLLIGCACCEGGAIANLVAFIVEQQWWSLGIAGVLLLAILSRFPTETGLESFIREQIELAEMERGR